MILTNSDFRKEFDNCVTLYKDFLKQYDSTQRETRRFPEVILGRHGGSGGKKVKDCYYIKDEYSKLFCDQKGKFKKICRKRGSNSGGVG